MNKKVYSTPTASSFNFELEGFLASSFGTNTASEEVNESRRSQKKDMWDSEKGKIWK